MANAAALAQAALFDDEFTVSRGLEVQADIV